MAGVFIAFASEGSNMAAFNLFANPDTYGLGKVLAGAVFGTGLMLVVIAGGGLFTGNTLIIVGVLGRKVKIRQLLSNWLVVYIGNFIGSVFIAYMMNRSMLFNSGNGVLGGQTKNLILVTLGNIVGGSGMVGLLYWVSLRKKKGA
jgi:formate/nitrite transporter FocA (FNT family)